MKIDIWSDIMCPFCYIGKRKFEMALEQFAHKNEVQVEWHSYQLQPDLQHEPGKDTYTSLSESKGISKQRAKEMIGHVTEMAKAEGLVYNFDNVQPANTFDAHRLTHLAASHGVQNEAEEQLFIAHFTEGKNIQDHETLVEIGVKAGLEAQDIRTMLASDTYAYEVKLDIQDAGNMGVSGVPFFVIDRKYGISGAQPTELFLNALQQAWQEQEVK